MSEPQRAFAQTVPEPAGTSKPVSAPARLAAHVKAFVMLCTVLRMLRSTLGWTLPNEINNGRWVMFGFAVGLLTEYATGVDFPHQLELIVSYLGIADFD